MTTTADGYNEDTVEIKLQSMEMRLLIFGCQACNVAIRVIRCDSWSGGKSKHLAGNLGINSKLVAKGGAGRLIGGESQNSRPGTELESPNYRRYLDNESQ